MTKELSKEEIIERAKNLRKDSDPTNIRLVVCEFYGDKCCSNTGEGSCEDDENVLTCKANYLERIFDRPQAVWTPEWETPLEREKKKIEVVQIGIQCNNCHISDSCPEYKKNYACAIEWAKEDFTNMTAEQMIDYLIAIQQERVSRAQKYELIDGGVPDTNLSLEMDRLSGLIAQKNEMRSARFSLNISGTANNPEGGGLLSQLLGGLKKEPPAEEKVEEQKAISIKSVETLEFSEELIEGRSLSKKEREKLNKDNEESISIVESPKGKSKSKSKSKK